MKYTGNGGIIERHKSRSARTARIEILLLLALLKALPVAVRKDRED